MTETKHENDSQFNLEHFLKNLTLEPMVHGKRVPRMPPPKCRSTSMPLVMRPGGYRKAVEIKELNRLGDEVTFFFNNFKSENPEAFKALNLTSQIPTRDLEKTYHYNPYEVEGNSSAIFVIERGPMKSVYQLVQTINPELNDLRFFTPSRSGTISAQKYDPAYFCTVDDEGKMDSIKCIIVALPPWDFAPQDFEDFTTACMFENILMGLNTNSLNGGNNDPPWCNADRMWAYVYDLCLMNDCHHFVLTTYEQWAFGTFSSYYTTGFVSHTIPWNSQPNSVLELLTYWVLNSCRTENTMIVEKIPREKHLDPDMLEQERLLCRERFDNHEPIAAAAARPNLSHSNGNDHDHDDEEDMRPRKRARKDPMEDRMGWAPLSQHADALIRQRPAFPLPRKQLRRVSKSVAAAGTSRREAKSDSEDDDDDNIVVRPCRDWNKWYIRQREAENKENPQVPGGDLGENAQTDNLLDLAPKLGIRPLFGHPIPCYSSDIDRDNDRYRPELVRLVSFPIPTPKLP